MIKNLLLTLKTSFNPFHKTWIAGFDAGIKVGKLLGSEAERRALLELIDDLTVSNPELTISEYPLLKMIHDKVSSGKYD